jgi:hypothetical protein
VKCPIEMCFWYCFTWWFGLLTYEVKITSEWPTVTTIATFYFTYLVLLSRRCLIQLTRSFSKNLYIYMKNYVCPTTSFLTFVIGKSVWFSISITMGWGCLHILMCYIMWLSLSWCDSTWLTKHRISFTLLDLANNWFDLTWLLWL